MYQQFLDEDDAWKKVAKDQDPFWDEPEDIAIGSASAFLQSLSYGLDFEDKLMLTDHRGNDQGSLSVVLTPCTKKGSPLGDDYFVEDPKELIDKEYYVKVDVRSADINNSRFTHGLYVQYGCAFLAEKKDAYKTKVLSGSLSPKWNDSRLISIPKMTEEILEAFESDSITFTVFGKQVEGKGNAPKMSTREMKEKQGVSNNNGNQSIASNSQRRRSIMDVGAQSSEIKTLQRRLDLLSRKEARLQELCKQHEKDKKDKNYQQFYDDVSKAVNSTGKFKKTVNMLTNDSNAQMDNQSIYSFEYDPSKHQYTTGANAIAPMDALGEEMEDFDEDLENTPPTKTEPMKVSGEPSPKSAAPKSSSSTAKPPTPTEKPKSKACTIM